MKDQPDYNLLFNRNHFDGKWYCFRREDYYNYFSDRNNENSQIASGNSQEEAFENWNKKYGTK